MSAESEFLLRGIKTLHGNNLLIWEEAKMFLVAAIIHVRVHWKYQVFNLRPFIPSDATGMVLPWEKSKPYVDVEKRELDVWQCETETSVIEICIFQWYTPFRLMLKLNKYAQAAEFFFFHRCMHSSPTAETWAPCTGAVTTFPKSPVIESFFNVGCSFQAHWPWFKKKKRALANSWERMKWKEVKKKKK